MKKQIEDGFQVSGFRFQEAFGKGPLSTLRSATLCVALAAGLLGGNVYGAIVLNTANDRCTGGTQTASQNQGPNSEGSGGAFDDSTSSGSKWQFANAVFPVWVRYQFAAGKVWVITNYTLSTGNDGEQGGGRPPRNWTLDGSHDGLTWTTVDSRVDGLSGAGAGNTYSFACNGGNFEAFEYYRLNVTANWGNNRFELAEIEMFGYDPRPWIVNRIDSQITGNSATFNATLTSTGSSATAVCLLWGAANGGATWNWEHTNWFNNGEVNTAWTNNTPFSTNITGLTEGTIYYFTYGASNTSGKVLGGLGGAPYPLSLLVTAGYPRGGTMTTNTINVGGLDRQAVTHTFTNIATAPFYVGAKAVDVEYLVVAGGGGGGGCVGGGGGAGGVVTNSGGTTLHVSGGICEIVVGGGGGGGPVNVAGANGSPSSAFGFTAVGGGGGGAGGNGQSGGSGGGGYGTSTTGGNPTTGQ
ncbi:MAG: glycine-rich domain-containing protein, partial [Kiritimatiellia bacterium]